MIFFLKKTYILLFHPNNLFKKALTTPFFELKKRLWLSFALLLSPLPTHVLLEQCMWKHKIYDQTMIIIDFGGRSSLTHVILLVLHQSPISPFIFYFWPKMRLEPPILGTLRITLICIMQPTLIFLPKPTCFGFHQRGDNIVSIKSNNDY